MNGYLDIHSHILPGIDDGSDSYETTMTMLQQAWKEGIRYMVATPHYYPGHENAEPEVISKVFQNICKSASEQFHGLQLMLGNEIYYKDEVPSLLKQKKLFSLNGSRYILVEFNVYSEYSRIYYAVKKLVLDGYYPILAHVERYSCLYKQEQLVEELVALGAYVQVNADTFLKGPFDGHKKYCLRLMQQGLVHFLGSDCHNTGNRGPVMQQAVTVLKKKISVEVLEDVLIKNPERFLTNHYI